MRDTRRYIMACNKLWKKWYLDNPTFTDEDKDRLGTVLTIMEKDLQEQGRLSIPSKILLVNSHPSKLILSFLEQEKEICRYELDVVTGDLIKRYYE